MEKNNNIHLFTDLVYNLCKKHNLKTVYFYENRDYFIFKVQKTDKHGYTITIENEVTKASFKSEEDFIKTFEEVNDLILKRKSNDKD
jgi:hypothetical protein